MKKFEKMYFDTEKDFFERLPQKEKEERIAKIGNKEGAIQQYGYELALRSADKKENFSLEEKKEYEKIKIGAENVIKSFSLKRSPDNKKGENLLIVTDAGADKLIIKALWDVGREVAGNDCRIIVAPKTEHAAQEFGESIGEKMKTADAILLVTSLSRSHAKETTELLHPHYSIEIIASLLSSPLLKNAFSNLKKYSPEELKEMLEKRKLDKSSEFPSRARIISITNTSREILTKGGALENPIEMAKRIERFAKIMKGVEKVKITGNNGTNLELDIKVPSLIKENGIINKPGMASNFPTGEYAGSVDLENTNGIYVIDGAIGMIGRPDKPIKLIIKQGKAVKIEGGKAAKKLQKILEEANKEYRKKNPRDKVTDAFRLAEFAFGMNSKAFRYTKDGKRISPPTSLEAEKGLGTIHIALGRNSLFNVEKSDPDYNDIPIHIDGVSMEPTVVGYKKDGKNVELVKNGKVVCL